MPPEDEYRRDIKSIKYTLYGIGGLGLIQTIILIAVLGSIPHI